MDTTTQTTSVLLVSKNPSVIESTRTILAKEETLKLIDKEVTSQDLFPVIAEAQPDVILLDFEFQQYPFELVDKIASKYSTCAVVVVLPESEEVDPDRVLLSGAWGSIQFLRRVKRKSHPSSQ